MVWVVKNRIADTSSTSGTGALALDANPPSGSRTFSAVCSVGDTCPYSIQHRTLNEWEDGIGTYSATNTLTRTTVRDSSNAGALVSFSAGLMDVVLPILADMVEPLDGGTF